MTGRGAEDPSAGEGLVLVFCFLAACIGYGLFLYATFGEWWRHE